jgi:pimeloyl-ACP methyl ester carboxylesterase
MEIEIQGINVYYEVIGQGQPIVMLHGGGLDHRHMLDELEPVFSKHPNWKRIYLDLPGNGRTPAKDWISSQTQVLEIILDFIEAVIPRQNFAIAGLSRGGYLARGVIYRRTAAVDGALLIVPASADDGSSPIPAHITLVEDASLLPELKPSETERFDMLVVQTRKTLDKMRETYYPAIALGDGELRTRIIQNYDFEFDVNQLPQPFTKPVLIVTGTQDDVTGYRDAWKMMDVFPRATFAVLDRAGHLLSLEQGELLLALVDEWLRRVEEFVSSR